MLRCCAIALTFTFAVACGGGTGNHPQDSGTSPIDQQTATALESGLGNASASLAASSPQAALAAQVADLALQAGVPASDVTISASLLAGTQARAALTSGSARAFGFQLQLLHPVGPASPETFSGVLLFQGSSDWILVAGQSPGSPFPYAVGLIGSGGQLWSATAGQESAQLQTEGNPCGVSLPAGVTSCKQATFSNAGFGITSSTPVSSGATGSKTASLPPGPLGAGVSLVIDCRLAPLCPGGASGPSQVEVTPATFILGPGGSQLFVDRVFGQGAFDNGVAWSVEEAGGGTVTSAGLYTAPSGLGTFHLRATSVADTNVFGRATITVSHPSGIGVTVTPSSLTLPVHGSRTFQAVVTNSPDTTVTWSVDESVGGSITDLGLYTASATSGTFHVRATTIADPTVFAEATVTVTASTVTVSAQPQETDGLTNLDCVASGAGPFTYAWHGYRDDGDTSGLSFDHTDIQAPQLTVSTTETFGANFYVYCVVSQAGSQAGTGKTNVTLTTGELDPVVTVSPPVIQAGTTDVSFDGSSTLNIASADKWTVQYYTGNLPIPPTTLEDYLKLSATSWSTVFTDASPSGLMETVTKAHFSSPGVYRVQLLATSNVDFSQNEGTYYFQVTP